MPVTVSLQKHNLPNIITQSRGTSESGLRRWTREEYHRMSEMDIFDGARVELLSGQIWQVYASDFYRWTPEQYHRMMEAGFFEDGRVELLEGLIWDMASQLTLHTTGVRLTQLALEEIFRGQFEVRVQMSITLPDGTEPEPDVAVAVGTPLDYLEHHPTPTDLLLVTEISDSSLVKDRGTKLASYARAWISEYWIINLVDFRLEVYRSPLPNGVYTDYQIYQPGKSVEPLSAPGKSVAVADLLPPEPKQKL